MPGDAELMAFMRAIAEGDAGAVQKTLANTPLIAAGAMEKGATRKTAKKYFLREIQHYVYAGDTALHVAAAAHQTAIARTLLKAGADVRARNLRGQEPLHYAADGIPGGRHWDPRAQAATVKALLAAGGDASAADGGGITPLHRAVRARCAEAVRVLVDGGADPKQKTVRGSTAIKMSKRGSGRSGSGSAEAKEQQEEIVELLAPKRRRKKKK
jgi:hypothetical protein